MYNKELDRKTPEISQS